MGGPRLTPEQMERAAQVFANTGNVSEAARSIGCAVRTLNDAFKRARIAKNRHVHAQACERGLRKARKQTDAVSDLLARLLDPGDADASSLGLEPGDIAKLVQALNGATAQRLALADRIERTRQSKLTRDKTRAEIELLRKKIAGDHVDRVEVSTDDALDERIATLLAAAQPDATDEGGAH